MKTNWGILIREGRAVDLADRVSALLGFPVPPDPFLDECVVAGGSRIDSACRDWSEGTWLTWLSNRAVRYRPPVRCYDDEAGPVIATFHLGFVGVPETADHLERIRRPEPVAAVPGGTAGERAGSGNVARSKIAKSNHPIRPVDRVARRVAPESRAARPPRGVGPGTGIFILKGGRFREVTREEWDARNPGQEPLVVG